jgi:glycosyltransferase involved in cell wall biosynthesis
MSRPPATVLNLCEHFGGADSSLHGVARTFQWMIPLFDSTRFRVLLCSRKGYDKAAAQMVRSGLAPLYLGGGKMDPRNLTRLVRIIRAEKVDIMHAHGFGASLWARLAGRMLKIPVIVHGRANYGTVPFVMRPVEALLGPGTRWGLAVSESTRRFMIEKRHIPAGNVEVVYNGIPPGRVQRLGEERRQALRQAEGISSQTRLLGVAGRIVGHKGHRDAFEALRVVRKRQPDTRLWVIGDGDYLPALRDWVRRHGMEECIRFLGFREDVMDLIQCLDVQIFPSHLEGTPNTLFEALAAGACIVANPVDGQGEILEDNRTALLFPVGDSAAMAGRIIRVLEDADLAAALREAALAKSLELDGRNAVRAIEALYERILGD